MGNLLSVAALFTLTEKMNPWFGFSTIGGILIISGIIVYCNITEPDIYNPKEEKKMIKKSFCS